jgi:hypothetical protein
VEVTEEGLEEFFSVISPLLDERQRRVVAGATARLLGRGGTTAVARAAEMSRNTVTTGATEIETGDAVPEDRVRRLGGGRKQAIDKDPNRPRAPPRDGL